MCLRSKASRRQVLLWAGIAATVGAENLSLAEQAYIDLPDKPEQFTAGFAKSAMHKIELLAKNPGKILPFRLKTDAGEFKRVDLSFASKTKGSLYPVLTDEHGRKLRLIHHGNAPLHEINFSTEVRDLFASLRKKAKEFAEELKRRLQGEDPIILAIQAVAAALAIWFVASVGKVILAGLAFFAAYAVVIALIIASAVIIGSLFAQQHSVETRTKGATNRFLEKVPEVMEKIAA